MSNFQIKDEELDKVSGGAGSSSSLANQVSAVKDSFEYTCKDLSSDWEYKNAMSSLNNTIDYLKKGNKGSAKSELYYAIASIKNIGYQHQEKRGLTDDYVSLLNDVYNQL